MRFTYIKDDKIVGINGEFLTIDNSFFNQEIHAIQWYDTWGEIEYSDVKRVNERFEDISYIQPLIDLWNIEEQKKPSTFNSENQKLINKINS